VHCRSPESCSVCLGEPARAVAIVGGLVVVDGVPVRPADTAARNMRRYQIKGGRR
jgi:hypothetical protein